MRLRILALGLAAGGVACGALLGLEDRTLRDAGLDLDAGDAQVDSPLCRDSGFCACSLHDFCEDFDQYKTAQELGSKGTLWNNTIGYPSNFEIPPSALSFDYATVSPPSLPNALLAHLEVNSGKAGVAILFGQVDPKVRHQNPVIGVEVRMEMLVDSLLPDDANTPFADSGALLLDDVLAIVDPVSSDGVGIALSDVGGFIGYALNVNTFTKTSLAQGAQFTDKAVPPKPVFLPFRVVVAPRQSIEVGAGTTCTQGPVLSQSDSGADASVGSNPMVIVVFPPPGIGTTACEILGGGLLDPSWIQRGPLLGIGGVQAGVGKFQVVFDNITLDFLEQ